MRENCLSGSTSGMWKRSMVRIMRHRLTKGPETDRPDLTHRATSRLYPYSRDKGGGPPCLWDFDGHLFESRWQEPNIEFLKNRLGAANNVIDVLTKAVDRLNAHSECPIAEKVLSDVPQCVERLAERCQALRRFLPLLLSWALICGQIRNLCVFLEVGKI